MHVVALSLSSPEEHLRAWHGLGVDFWREEMPDVDPIGELEAYIEANRVGGSNNG